MLHCPTKKITNSNKEACSFTEDPSSDKLNFQAYKSHSPPLKIIMAKEFMKKMTTMTTINPYLSVSMADTGAHVIILGHNRLSKIGLNQ